MFLKQYYVAEYPLDELKPELDRMVNDNIIESISELVKKPDNVNIKICLDLQNLNESIIREYEITRYILIRVPKFFSPRCK